MGFDVTLFQFGHRVRCHCGVELSFPGADLRSGHTRSDAAFQKEGGPMAEVELGTVTHYFGKIGVAAIEIQHDMLAVGDTIHVKGHTSDFTQNVDSMQVDHQAVTVAKAGQSVGIHLAEHAHEHDKVYKVVA
jgi:putative protease